MHFFSRPLLFPAQLGAYTELFAGLDAGLTLDHSGAYIIPWGRIHPRPKPYLLDALKSRDEGGRGRAAEFREWCEKRTAEYLT